MSVSARFYVQQITKNASGYTNVVLAPVVRASGLPGADDNKSWAHYTPSGKIEMSVSPDTGAGAWFEEMLGKDVAITFDTVE